VASDRRTGGFGARRLAASGLSESALALEPQLTAVFLISAWRIYRSAEGGYVMSVTSTSDSLHFHAFRIEGK
jgi:hypothetical protein